jgi:hypothetical protein
MFWCIEIVYGIDYPIDWLYLKHGHPTCLGHKATPIIVGWFADHMWKNNKKWYT